MQYTATETKSKNHRPTIAAITIQQSMAPTEKMATTARVAKEIATANQQQSTNTGVSTQALSKEQPAHPLVPMLLLDQQIVNKRNAAKLNWWNAPPPCAPISTDIPIETMKTTTAKTTAATSTPIATPAAAVSQQQTPTQPHELKLNFNANVEQQPQNYHHHHHHHHHQHHRRHSKSPVTTKSTIAPAAAGVAFHQQNLSASEKFQNAAKQQFDADDQDQQDDGISQDSELLMKDHKSCRGILNPDEDDEMIVTGYRRSKSRTALCWLCICLTGGLLRLIMHWWCHWYLIATHKPCPLGDAETVLVQEDYQGKHKIYYVKTVQNLSAYNLNVLQQNQPKKINLDKTTVGIPMEHENDGNEKNFHLSLHFSSGYFKHVKSLRVFNCKQLRYAWDSQTQSFHKIKGLDVNVPSTYLHQQRGLTLEEQQSRRMVYGSNEISIPYKDVKTLLFLEVLNPFYVFQIFSVILWFAYDYYYYACVILLMSVFGISMSILQTKKNQDALRETVFNTGNALVLTERGEVNEIPTHCLVPGDIIQIPTSGCTMQCDAVLLSGNCILDEAMLTGESVPVTKTPLPLKRDIIFDKKEHARHTLFCGTKVIQTRYIGSEKVLAIVINTGNITAKGGLIRSILYPPPVDYKFEQDSYKFIECLGLIALIGFVYTLVTKIMRGVDPVKIAVESLDLITIVVPPALPAAMTVGRFYAQKRLEHNSIYCISPRSINVAGSIDCCCFDKTGTLTEEGLDMWGVVPKSATNNFQIPIKEIDRLPVDHFLFSMVTCHSITIMNGKMMGDPLDLKMFESTGWKLEDPQNIPDSQKFGLIHPTIVRQPIKDASTSSILCTDEDCVTASVQRQSSVNDLLADVGLLNGEHNNDHGIVREFPFSSSLQRMSVITRRLSDNHFSVYCKGSPEKLQQLCHPNSMPDNYSQQLAIFAKQGYRVIAMAYKPLSHKMNYTKAQRLTRECVESDLEFLGFVVLENRLKPDTTEVIGSLTAANIRTIMVTGDNILTAVSVARDCGIVEETQAIVTINVRHTSHNEQLHELYYTLEMGNKDGGSAKATKNLANGNGNLSKRTVALDLAGVGDYGTLNSDITSITSTPVLPNSSSLNSVQTCDTWTHHDVEMGRTTIPTSTSSITVSTDLIKATNMNNEPSSWRQNYRFAMVGETWQIVREHFPDELANFVTRGSIFARMSPDQKQALIMELQNLDYSVAMCGDGANDCGALKVAHTGISLSETESSIASPFTSRNPTIACVPKVIKEGRAALVTSFGIFKYMAAYSMVQFISVMILYSIDSNLTDKQYLYIDLGLISVFAFFFGRTESYGGALVKQVPLSSLISLTPLASLILHLLVVVVFQVACWFHIHHQDWFIPYKPTESDHTHFGCYENYAMFAISSFQYITLAFVFSKGAPYRKPIWSNLPFCLSLVINLCIVVYLLEYPTKWVADFFQLILPPVMGFRYIMLIYGAVIFVVHVLLETIVIEYILFQKVQVRHMKQTNNRKHTKIEFDLKHCPNWPVITYTERNDGETTGMEATPIYVEMRAGHKSHMPVPQNTSLFGFFEDTPVMTPQTPETPITVGNEIAVDGGRRATGGSIEGEGGAGNLAPVQLS